MFKFGLKCLSGALWFLYVPGGTLSVIVIIIRNAIGNSSSNPG